MEWFNLVSKSSSRPSKEAPRPLDARKRPTTPPKRPHDVPIRAQGAPKTAQGAFKTSPKASKIRPVPVQTSIWEHFGYGVGSFLNWFLEEFPKPLYKDKDLNKDRDKVKSLWESYKSRRAAFLPPINQSSPINVSCAFYWWILYLWTTERILDDDPYNLLL